MKILENIWKEYQGLDPSKNKNLWILVKKISFPTGSKERKNFETSNETIALNVMFFATNNEGIKKKHNYIFQNKTHRVKIK